MIAIIKYNAGNIRSVAFALERLGVDYCITDNPEAIQSADKVIFPGVGEARSAMDHLLEKGLDKVISTLKQPVLGICLGMQLLCRQSEERDTICLGVFNERAVRFQPGQQKIPHIGWNSLKHVSGWLPASLENEYTYFVHSYYVPLNVHTVAVTSNGTPFSAAIRAGNFYGVQFHPEKSAGPGMRVLQCFLALK